MSGRMNGGQTPADAEVMIEASDATLNTKIKRDEVYEMFKPVIEDLMNNSTPVEGKLISECYDLHRHRPSAEYSDLIRKVKDQFRDCGLQWL
jgi:hypothetical protein